MDKSLFMANNPWLSGQLPTQPKLSRPIYDRILELAEQPKVLLIFGPRGAGKTTLLKELAGRLVSSQKADPQKVFYLDLDTMDPSDVLRSAGHLLEFCGLDPDHPPRDLTYILIDEIQRLHDPGLLLTTIYDHGLPLRLIVTGSSDFALHDRANHGLGERSISLFLGPLAPPEIPLDDSYLAWGGFPEVILAVNDTERRQYLAQMWAAYVDGEIGGFLRVQKTDCFRSFAQLLAAQAGHLVNLNELAGTLGVSRDTVARYLSYLRQYFLVRDLRPLTTNRRGETSKMPKVFFSDPGLLNVLSGHPGQVPLSFRPALMQNSVEIMLRAEEGDLFFWRTDRGAHVDFVWRRGQDIIPVEVTAAAMSRPRISRGYRNFLKTYRPNRGIVVNGSLDLEAEIEGTIIHFVPTRRFG